MFLFDGAQKRETLSKVKAACFVISVLPRLYKAHSNPLSCLGKGND